MDIGDGHSRSCVSWNRGVDHRFCDHRQAGRLDESVDQHLATGQHRAVDIPPGPGTAVGSGTFNKPLGPAGSGGSCQSGGLAIRFSAAESSSFSARPCT
jgi:hypothetical protein